MFDRIAVYAVAHQDDWQLFMEPDISRDMLDPVCKTIIIYTTAGDAGEGWKFCSAREKGALGSLRFRLPGNPGSRAGRAGIGDKKIYRVDVAGCSSYFLRLPDGGMHGDGFSRYHFQSLEKLRTGRTDRITTVDGVNTFGGFPEIGGLVDQIVARELARYGITERGRVTLNFPEYDPLLSPHDHSDHLNTALLLRHTPLYNASRKYAFVHYDIGRTAGNLAGTDLFWKTGLFCVYHQTVLDAYGYSTLDESPQYHAWCTKQTKWREIV